MLPDGVNGVVSSGGMRPLAKTGFFSSAISIPLCCTYIPTILSASNNRIIGTTNALTNGYYGTRNNINPFCNTPCPPDVLLAVSGSTKNFVGGLPVLRLGDPIGVLGAVVIGNPSNTYCT